MTHLPEKPWIAQVEELYKAQGQDLSEFYRQIEWFANYGIVVRSRFGIIAILPTNHELLSDVRSVSELVVPETQQDTSFVWLIALDSSKKLSDVLVYAPRIMFRLPLIAFARFKRDGAEEIRMYLAKDFLEKLR